jgi:putative nucleotidyltransferase with HDIG domain
MLINEQTNIMNIVIANGLDLDIVRNAEIKIGEGISGHVAKTGEPLLISNIDEESKFIKSSSMEYSTRSALSVPLKVKDKVIGVINVNNKKNGKPLSDSDSLLLQTLSSQISSAIDNAKLYNQMQQRIVEITMLQNVGQVINSTLDLSEVLKLVLDQILGIFDADMGSLMLWDEVNDCLKITEQRGLDNLYSDQVSFKSGEGVAGGVYARGRGILILNSLNDENYKKFGNESEKIAKTLMCVPISIKGIVQGVLSCEKRLDHTGSFTKENLNLMTTISSQASVAIENANLYNDLLDLYLHTIQSLAAAIDAKDSYTHGHSKRVMYFSIAIAKEMGYSGEKLNTLRHTALLHDIGKIGISESILQKPGKLTDEEFDNIRSHPVLGSHILESIDFLKDVRLQMKHHHEKYDGTGYPDRLKGEDIPLGSRIIAVADTYDAMTSTRSYREGLKHEVAVAEIKRCSGTQFDPQIVEAFLVISDNIRDVLDNDEDIKIPRFNPTIKSSSKV